MESTSKKFQNVQKLSSLAEHKLLENKVHCSESTETKREEVSLHAQYQVLRN